MKESEKQPKLGYK